MSQEPFAQFEDRVQQLIEESFSRLFSAGLHPRDVAVRLSRALEDGVRDNENGLSVAPDSFTIRLNPDDHQKILDSQPDVSKALAEELVTFARGLRLILLRMPDIQFIPDARVQPHRVVINSRHHDSQQMMTATQPLNLKEKMKVSIPSSALILEDDRFIDLTRPIINIGRGRDNHIVIDDSRVSRHHAQIRLRFDRFTIFDLGSSGGTTVNGIAITESSLRSNDEIGLAGYSILYRQFENKGQQDISDGTTQDLPHPDGL